MTPPSTAVSGRRLAGDSVIYGMSFVMSRLASVIMLPLYTRVLTPEEYGVLQLLQITLDIVAILLSEGTVVGVQRFYFKRGDEAGRHAVLASAFTLLVTLHAVGGLLIVASAPLVSQYVLDGSGSTDLVRLAGLNFFLGAFLPVPQQYMQVQQRAFLSSVTALSKLVVQLSLNVFFLVALGFGVAGILLSSAISSVLVGGTAAVWMLRRVGLHFDAATARELRRFGLPYQLGAVATFALSFGDRFFLQAYRSTAEVGIYGLAYQFGNLLQSLSVTPITRAWSPIMHQLAHASREERDARYNTGLLLLGGVTVSVALGISLFVRPVIRVMSDPAFWSASPLVPLLLLAFILQHTPKVFRIGLEIAERTRYLTYANWMAAVVVLAGYWLLIPRWGAWGAAVATLIGFAVFWVAIYYWSQRAYPVSWRFGRVATLLGYAIALTLVKILLQPEALLPDFALGAALYVVYVGLAWRTVLAPGHRNAVLRLGRGAALRVRRLVPGGA